MKEKVFHYFSDQMHFQRRSTVFKKLLYILVLVKSVFWLSHYALYFGENSIIYTKPFSNLGIIQNAAFLLHQMNSNNAGFFFILPALLIALAGFFKFPNTNSYRLAPLVSCSQYSQSNLLNYDGRRSAYESVAFF